MARKHPRFSGPAIVSAAAAAALLGAPTASAQEVCVICPEPTPTGPPGLANAFHKLAELKFPGATEQAFLKVGTQNAFHKLEDKAFPGNTENVFYKQ